LLAFFSRGQAEVELVTIVWKASTCPLNCARMLEAQLRTIPGVASVTVYPLVGRAELRWRPMMPFSFAPINTAVRSVGPSIFQMLVKARGVIRVNAGNYQLISLGDNTPFNLIGPVMARPGQYTISANIASHPISPELKANLDRAMMGGYVTLVEGPLFEFWRTPVLYLITEQIRFVQPEAKSLNPYTRVPTS
jgi:hypothetical protein